MNGQIGDDHDILIECRDVHKSFGNKKVLNGISFKVSSFSSNSFQFPILIGSLVFYILGIICNQLLGCLVHIPFQVLEPLNCIFFNADPRVNVLYKYSKQIGSTNRIVVILNFCFLAHIVVPPQINH